jgi:hypothetical protein
VSDHEVEDVVRHLKAQGAPEYLDAITEEPMKRATIPIRCWAAATAIPATTCTTRRWPWWRATSKASTSYIQRRLQIGYNRAASLIERMEQDGVVKCYCPITKTGNARLPLLIVRIRARGRARSVVARSRRPVTICKTKKPGPGNRAGLFLFGMT